MRNPILDYSGVDLYIHKKAAVKMLKHCNDFKHLGLEVMGFMVGYKYRWGGEVYTVVEDVVTSDLDSSNVSVKFSNFKPLFKVLNRFEKEGREYILVGWYHSHPGHTSFMSPTDRDTQKRMFKMEYQSAVVIDPMNLEMKAFTLRDEEVFEKPYAIVPYPMEPEDEGDAGAGTDVDITFEPGVDMAEEEMIEEEMVEDWVEGGFEVDDADENEEGSGEGDGDENEEGNEEGDEDDIREDGLYENDEEYEGEMEMEAGIEVELEAEVKAKAEVETEIEKELEIEIEGAGDHREDVGYDNEYEEGGGVAYIDEEYPKDGEEGFFDEDNLLDPSTGADCYPSYSENTLPAPPVAISEARNRPEHTEKVIPGDGGLTVGKRTSKGSGGRGGDEGLDALDYAWFAAPVLMGILGGMFGFYAIGNRKKGMGKWMLILGAIFTLIWFGGGYLIRS